jgi:Zn-dependent peptidase ImmA (M78 family)
MRVDDLFRGRCTDLARKLASAYCQSAPPYDLDCLRARYNVDEVRERVLNQDAQLVATGNTYTIEVSSSVSAARRRMSVAHEFGHLIVNEVAGGHSFEAHSSLEVERLCHTLACELICPQPAILRHFGQQHSLGGWHDPIRCQSVLDAALAFGVSVDVMARRIFLDLQMAPSSVALVWRFGTNTKTTASETALRVASVWHSLGEKTFVPLNKTAPCGSVVRKAFEREGSFCGMESVELGSVKGVFEIEASGFMSFPLRSVSPPTRAVLSLLR